MLNKLKKSITYKLWTIHNTFNIKPINKFNIIKSTQSNFVKYPLREIFPKFMGINTFIKHPSLKFTRRQYGSTENLWYVVEFSLLTCIGSIMYQEWFNPLPSLTNVTHIEHVIDKPLLQAKLNPLDSYISINGIERKLRFSMLYDICGVHIMSMPSNSGKTTVAKHVANDLVSEAKLCGAIYRYEYRRHLYPRHIFSKNCRTFKYTS